MATELKLSEADFKGICILLQRISIYICVVMPFCCQPDPTLKNLCDTINKLGTSAEIQNVKDELGKSPLK